MTLGRWTEGVALAPHTSWQIGGPCRAFAEPETPEELVEARFEAIRRGWPVFLMGAGTNLLIADEGYPGLVIRYAGRRQRVEIDGSRAIATAEARTPLAGLARELSRAGWAGLAWAEGIPGFVAGGVVGNAGAYGGNIAGCLAGVQIVQPDGSIESWEPARMRYAYRSSILKGLSPAGPAVVTASFRLERGDPALLAQEMQRFASQRKSKTPPGASCGCVFRNPVGCAAGQLIQQVGCSGMRCGGAVVSPMHANYIINEGGARARDVLELIEAVRKRVRDDTGISLDLEIQLVGFGDA